MIAASIVHRKIHTSLNCGPQCIPADYVRGLNSRYVARSFPNQNVIPPLIPPTNFRRQGGHASAQITVWCVAKSMLFMTKKAVASIVRLLVAPWRSARFYTFVASLLETSFRCFTRFFFVSNLLSGGRVFSRCFSCKWRGKRVLKRHMRLTARAMNNNSRFEVNKAFRWRRARQVSLSQIIFSWVSTSAPSSRERVAIGGITSLSFASSEKRKVLIRKHTSCCVYKFHSKGDQSKVSSAGLWFQWLPQFRSNLARK